MPDEPSLPDGPEHRSGGPSPESLERLRGGAQGRSLGAAGRYAGLGLQFVVSLLFFLWVGQWLDRRFGTDPVFLYVGVFTGAGGAFYSMYRTLMADQRRDEQEQARRKAAEQQSSPRDGRQQ